MILEYQGFLNPIQEAKLLHLMAFLTRVKRKIQHSFYINLNFFILQSFQKYPLLLTKSIFSQKILNILFLIVLFIKFFHNLLKIIGLSIFLKLKCLFFNHLGCYCKIKLIHLLIVQNLFI